MSKLIRVASASDIPVGEGREVLADGIVIAIYNLGGEFCALDGICPHAGGPLAEGDLEGPIVTCPWHGWQFDVRTGKNCLSEQITHRRYVVKVEGDDLYVEIP